MVACNLEHQIFSVEETAWDEDLSMVIELDEDDIFSYSGHESFMNYCGNENETNLTWNSTLIHHADIYDSMKRDEFDCTSKNTTVYLNKRSDNTFKPQEISRQIPLVDMLGEILSTQTIELEHQQYESPNADVEGMINTDEPNVAVYITLDEQLAVAQKKLEESICRSQITRPKFIQFSESMMKNEACYDLLVNLKSSSLK